MLNLSLHAKIITVQLGNTALMAAARAGHLTTVQYLAGECKASVNYTQTVCCFQTVERNNRIELLIPMRQDGSTALIFAAREGHTDIVKYLAKCKANINATAKVCFVLP